MSGPSLANHVAVISGGLGDIGRAVAIELASRGASVALGDLEDAASAARLLDDCRGACGRNGRASYARVDVADASSVDRWMIEVERELDVPTLIIVNAATVTTAGVLDMTPEQWERELAVNLNGAFHLASACARRLVAAKRAGRIIFLGSWAADRPHVRFPAYSASKAGLRMLCRCMALELAPAGILVNEIAPGFVDAGLSAKIFREQPGVRDQATRSVPVGRLITPAEVARQVAYLCGESGEHVTGSVLLMDGGLSLGGSIRTKDEHAAAGGRTP